MGFGSLLMKAAERKAHALLDKVPTASIAVRAYTPDGLLFAEQKDLSKNVFTRAKAEEWANHLNAAQKDTNRPDIVWKVVDMDEEPEVVQGEYIVHGEVKDSDRAFDGVIMDD